MESAQEYLALVVIFSIFPNFGSSQSYSGCNPGDLTFRTGVTGVVDSKNYPAGYTSNLDCYWLINTGSSKRTQITFVAFRTQLMNDYVRFYAGNDTSSPFVGQYSGTTIPTGILINSPLIYVHFHTDASTVDNGFRFIWKSTTASSNIQSGCGANDFKFHNYATGTIKSANYPANYDNNLNCYWSIDTTGAYNTKLLFYAFDTEYGSDYLKIYKGLSTSRTLISTLTGSLTPTITIAGRYVFLWFHTNAQNTDTGFLLTWGQTNNLPTGCSGVHNMNTSTLLDTAHYPGINDIKSTNYPSNYLPHSNCYWQITGPKGKDLTIYFSSTYQLEAGSDICYDYVAIYTGVSLVGKYCGYAKPNPVIVKGNQVTVKFISNGGNQLAGFELYWRPTSPPTGEVSSDYYTMNYHFYGYSVTTASLYNSLNSLTTATPGRGHSNKFPGITTIVLSVAVLLVSY